MKTTVVVGRQWHKPEIEIKVCNEAIKIEIKLEDFISALCQEAGNPSMTMTVKGLEKKLKEAALRVVDGMKQETAKVM